MNNIAQAAFIHGYMDKTAGDPPPYLERRDWRRPAGPPDSEYWPSYGRRGFMKNHLMQEEAGGSLRHMRMLNDLLDNYEDRRLAVYNKIGERSNRQQNAAFRATRIDPSLALSSASWHRDHRTTNWNPFSPLDPAFAGPATRLSRQSTATLRSIPQALRSDPELNRLWGNINQIKSTVWPMTEQHIPFKTEADYQRQQLDNEDSARRAQADK